MRSLFVDDIPGNSNIYERCKT